MRHATIEDARAVAELLARCREADAQPALSEFKALRVPVANAVRTLVSAEQGELQALAVAAWHPTDLGEDAGYWASEIAIDPSIRSEAGYVEVLRHLAADLGRTPAYWAFNEMQEAAARRAGLREARAILEMHRGLPAPDHPLPAGYVVRSFAPGDEGLWLALNQQVFAHHPEAGAIDSADLALRMAQPWFDPAGLLILESDGGAAGYCWTKMHPGSVGEIYMIGLAPSHRGSGLAKPLTSSGLAHVARRGAQEAMLYAEASNDVAVALYQSMGFEVARRVVLYEGELL